MQLGYCGVKVHYNWSDPAAELGSLPKRNPTIEVNKHAPEPWFSEPSAHHPHKST